MKFLVTNDDGIDAPGIAVLERVLARHGEVLVVAPDQARSGCGHQVTTDRPLHIEARGAGRYAIDGMPADCTRVALVELAKHLPLAAEVDWVVSGVNAGANLGADVFHSGTVAAVREAALLGKPGLAISHYRRAAAAIDWDLAAGWVDAICTTLLRRRLAPGRFFNVNLPHLAEPQDCPEIITCPLDLSPLPVAYRSETNGLQYAANYHLRPRIDGSDIAVCFGGRVALTELAIG